MEIDGMVGLLLVGLWLYAIFDVVTTDPRNVRNLSKGLWLLIVIVLVGAGAIAWMMLGRPRTEGWQSSETVPRRPRPRPRAARPDDSADFMARIEARDRLLAAWAEEDRRKAESRAGPQDQPDTAEVDRRLAELEAELGRPGVEHRPEDEASGG
jgi:hypothetical protein